MNPAARGVIALVAAASLLGGCGTGPAPVSASPTSAAPLAGVQDPAVRAQIDWVRPLPGARAGSGLVRDGDRMLLVMDIANQAMWIDTSTEPPATSTVDLGSDPAPLPKDEKPDFEAALLDTDGSILILGSGSGEKRRTVVRLDPATGTAERIDASTMYDTVAGALGEQPNIEGALRDPSGSLILFNRANGGGRSATVELSGDFDSGEWSVVALQDWNLGTLPGLRDNAVPLGFSDVTRGSDGRLWFTASAEDSPDAVQDGQSVGTVIGTIDADGATWTHILDPDGTPTMRKFEGLVVDDNARGAWLVTDPDSEAPSELARVDLSDWPAA